MGGRDLERIQDLDGPIPVPSSETSHELHSSDASISSADVQVVSLMTPSDSMNIPQLLTLCQSVSTERQLAPNLPGAAESL